MLKLYAIIAFVIFLVIGGLSGALYLSVESNKQSAASIATLKQDIAAYKSSVETLQTDAVQIKARQEALDTTLNDIRQQTTVNKEKIVIPARVLHDGDSAALAKIINAQTKATLNRFEVLTKSGSK